MLILTKQDVQRALPMHRAIPCVGDAYRKYSSGQTQVPLRQSLESERGTTLVMPAQITGEAAGVKVVSVYEDNPQQGLPAVLGAMLLLDIDTGEQLALLEASSLTAIRTGASGGLAAKHLARPESETAALFGAGVQGRTQLLALNEVLPLKQIRVYDLQLKKSERFISRVKTEIGDDIEWTAAQSPHLAVRDADVVVCATTSRQPVFDGSDLSPGTHITGVGSYKPQMREIDSETLQCAERVVVDSRQACLEEAGDFIIPLERGDLGKEVVEAEIGLVVAGQSPGRLNDEEITVFKAVGLGVLDAAAACEAYRWAERNSVGTSINMRK